jgi:hypothetical protein
VNKRIRIFQNRQLAADLKINLARWKRWSLAFLPPDPLSGQQSGHARQYYAQDAFDVYLGGHLVAEIGFTIQESRRILEDLTPLLAAHRFGFDPRAVPMRLDARHPRRRHRVAIRRFGCMAFAYQLMAILEDAPADREAPAVRIRRYRVHTFTSPAGSTAASDPTATSCRELDLSGVYWQFVRLMGLSV